MINKPWLPGTWGVTLGVLAALGTGCNNGANSTDTNTAAANTATSIGNSASNATTNSAPSAAGLSTAPAAKSSIATADLDKVTKANKPYKLALIVKTLNNPFFTPMVKAAEAEAKKLGAQLETKAPPQETDKEQQFALVQNVTAEKVDAILVTPADSQGIIPALKQAQDKGVVIINLDNRVDKAAASAAQLALGGYVGADNEAGGRMAGQAMIKALGGKGQVAVLEGIRGADNAEARKRGFNEATKGALTIVTSESAEWDTQKAYNKFQSMLPTHPEMQGLFCANDKMALGALKAIQDARKTGKITVIGYDNIPDVQSYLQNGQMYATIDQHPDLMGKYGVRMAIGILNGTVPKGREFLVPLELVTKKAGR